MRLKKKDYKILEKKLVFETPLFKIYEVKLRLPTGKVVKWSTMGRLDVVSAVPLTDKNEVVLTKEFRPAMEDFCLMIPGGKTTARTEKKRKAELDRELKEEIGYKAGKLEKLATFYLAPHFSYKLHLYLATDLKKVKRTPEEGEIIEVVKLPFDKAWKEIVSRTTTEPATITGLAMVKLKLGL